MLISVVIAENMSGAAMYELVSTVVFWRNEEPTITWYSSVKYISIIDQSFHSRNYRIDTLISRNLSSSEKKMIANVKQMHIVLTPLCIINEWCILQLKCYIYLINLKRIWLFFNFAQKYYLGYSKSTNILIF